jgi:hypothetical protein
MTQAVTFAERHYTVQELADLWRLSPKTIRRQFRNEPGVLRYGNPKKGHRRDYVTLRIPHSVAERVYRRCLLPDRLPPKRNHNGPYAASDLKLHSRLPRPDVPPRQSASAGPPQKPDSVAP